jgi:hypothetical protein
MGASIQEVQPYAVYLKQKLFHLYLLLLLTQHLQELDSFYVYRYHLFEDMEILHQVKLHAHQQLYFRYEPLLNPQDIRVVQILPSSKNLAQIECRMLAMNISNKGCRYHCLSYVWGSPNQNRSILCDNRTLQITDNLFIALKNLQRNGDTTPIWIDQLCINQENTAERNKQVTMMATIYEMAEKTIIWLGEEADNSHLAIKLIQNKFTLSRSEYNDLLEVSTDKKENVEESDGLDTLSKLGVPDMKDKSWQALHRLLQRPWFKRSWVSNALLILRAN